MDLGLRIDEEFARWSFEQYLESKGVSKQEWSKGGERRLPPDCYLTVDDKVFVVEITTLIEKVNTSRKVVSRITIDETVEDFVEEIEKEQLDEGLSGLYYLRFPPVDVDFYSHRHRLKNSILTYIRSTQFQGQFDPENIVGIPYCSIQKSDKSMNGIVIAAYPPDSRWAIDIPSEACDLLQEVISKKKDRIRGLDKPKIWNAPMVFSTGC